MKPTGFTKPMNFTRPVNYGMKYAMDFLTKNVNSYLDGTGFTHTLQKRWLGRKILKHSIPYAIPKVKELPLVVVWHTLWQPYHLEAASFYVSNTKVVWMVSGLDQWYKNFSQMCTRNLNNGEGVCFCRTGVQCKTHLLL